MRLLGLIALLFAINSCKKPVVIPQGEILVASVGDNTLYLSDLEQIIHPNISEQDSLALATAYIDQWVRAQLMTDQANRFFSTDPEIEQLVSDYEGELLGFKLEEKILSERYDTVVTQEELVHYYGEMKSQFLLPDHIYRCLYVKIKRDQEGLGEFRDNWKTENINEVHTFALAFAEDYHSDTTLWRSWGDISSWYERWSTSKISQQQIQTQRDNEYEYFLKIVDQEAKGEVSPLAYIEKQLVRMLLHKKRGQVLEDYKQELYEKALNNNLIKLP